MSRTSITMTLCLPSEQAKRGDEYLENARAIRDEWKNVIPRGDLSIVKNRLTMATEMRAGLDLKRGLSKLSHALAYRKYAQETLGIVKTTSDRARDFLTTHETHDEQEARVVSTAEAIHRSFFGYRDAFPTTEQESSIAPSANLMEKLAVVGPQFRACVKGKIAPLVERYYGFETSKAPKSLSHNIELARALKTDATFSKGDEENELPYHHRIIQQAINVVWFNDRSSDGVVFSDLFSPMPYEAIALVLAVIECCIDEWSNGPWMRIPFAYENYKDVYCNHLEVLKGLSDQGLRLRSCDPLRQLRYEIFNRGRDHAGVPRRFINQGDHWTRDQAHVN